MKTDKQMSAKLSAVAAPIHHYLVESGVSTVELLNAINAGLQSAGCVKESEAKLTGAKIKKAPKDSEAPDTFRINENLGTATYEMPNNIVGSFVTYNEQMAKLEKLNEGLVLQSLPPVFNYWLDKFNPAKREIAKAVLESAQAAKDEPVRRNGKVPA